MEGFTKAPFWLAKLDLYMVNDTFVWNTATICVYDILAFGSMIGFLISVYNILHNIAVHNSIL